MPFQQLLRIDRHWGLDLSPRHTQPLDYLRAIAALPPSSLVRDHGEVHQRLAWSACLQRADQADRIGTVGGQCAITVNIPRFCAHNLSAVEGKSSTRVAWASTIDICEVLTSRLKQSVADEFSHLTAPEVASRLKTSVTHGLTPAEALSRLRDFGPNEIPHDPPEPLWLRFLGQFKEPLILLLLASAGASVLVGNVDDALSITIAVTIVVAVGFVQEYRSEKSIEALSHLVPNHAHLIRSTPVRPAPGTRTPNWQLAGEDGPEEYDSSGAMTPAEDSLEAASSKVMAGNLVPGDLVLFTTGDRIPADLRVTKAVDLTIDLSNLTGEAEPVKVTAEPRVRTGVASANAGGSVLQLPTPTFTDHSDRPTKGTDQYEGRNIAYMGTLVKSGHGQGLVFATGGDTQFGTIATSVTDTESPRSPLQLSMDQLGSQLSKFSFVVIGLISLAGWIQGKALLDIFTISISLAVAAIPEGLPIIVTVTLALGVHRMARHNAIVRKMPKVETLGSVNVVCSDKTGELDVNKAGWP